MITFTGRTELGDVVSSEISGIIYGIRRVTDTICPALLRGFVLSFFFKKSKLELR